MKKSDFTTLMKQLSPHLPEVRMKPPMIVFPPFKEVLRGLYFERAGSDAERRFYIWVFFMPLCIPSQHVTFNLGRRIGGNEQRWHFRDPKLIEKIISSLENDALPFLENVGDLHEAACFALSTAGAAKSPHIQQAHAYMLARAGEISDACKSLEKLLDVSQLDVPWQAAMAARAQKLLMLLVNSPEDAKAQLETWECETVHNLGLDGLGLAVAKT